jgi:hypothetical protein
MRTSRVASWIYSFRWAFTLSLALFPVCRAVLVNRTIDSSYGDPLTGFIPQYYPPGDWEDQTQTLFSIDPKLAFDGTWMTNWGVDGGQNLTLQFTGMS